MDPIELIKSDHRAVEALFAEYEGLGETAFATKRALADQIIAALTLHTDMEETIAYPAFKESFTHEEEKMVEEGYAEHEVAKHLMEEIRSLSPEDPQFDAKVKVLKESIAHHVEEEEDELLPKAEREVPADRLAEIGQEMQDYKLANAPADEPALE